MQDPSVAYWHQLPVIEIEHACCPRHWTEFATRLPKRTIIMWPLHLWQQLMADEPFQKAAGIWQPTKPMPLPADWTATNRAMRAAEFAPWCCYLGRQRREEAYLECPFKNAPGGN